MPSVTWLDVVKTQLAANPGKSVKDVVPEARKEWNLIKSGKHPTKTKGKMVVKRKGKRKSKKAKRRGKSSKSRSKRGRVTKRSKRKSCSKKYKECLSKKNKKHTRKNKSRKSRGQSPWIIHVKSVAKKQNISYKNALKVAAGSYNK